MAENTIKCWHCLAEFEIRSAAWCNHASKTKICPFCLKCFCDASDSFKQEFLRRCPGDIMDEMLTLDLDAKQKIGDILVAAGKITAKQLAIALETQKKLQKKLGEVLIQLEFISPQDLHLFLLKQNSTDNIDLSDFEIDYQVLDAIGVKLCMDCNVIPMEIQVINSESVLRVAFGTPEDLSRFQAAIQDKQYKLIPYQANPKDIIALLASIKLAGHKAKASGANVASAASAANAGESDAQHVKTLNSILKKAMIEEIDDIYFEMKGKQFKMYFSRGGGSLNELTIEITEPRAFFNKVKQIAGIQKNDGVSLQKSYIELSRDISRYRLKTYYHPGTNQESIHIKVINTERYAKMLNMLNITAAEAQIIVDQLCFPHGLYLIAGESQNSSAEFLYAMMNTMKKHRIATVESCVMQKLDHCFQLEIDSNEVGGKVLENLIHFNPSMLVLFDFFPKNYHADFFKFCQQGKLVLELQCTSYSEMLQKIRDDYVSPDSFLREYLRFIVFHKTAKPLCPACKELHSKTSAELFPDLNLTRTFEIYREIGCAQCYYSGYGKDKTFYELFIMSDDDRNTFTFDETNDYLRTISEAGNMTINNKILSGVLKGEFSYNEFVRASGI